MIYLDYNATAPMHPHVLAAMLPYFSEQVGNPSSIHAAGRAVRQGLDEARRRVAAFLAVHESQVVFTSGGTEANNTVLWGCGVRQGFRGHIVTTAVEHSSVLQSCEWLKRAGMEVTLVAVDAHGCVPVEAVVSAIREDTVLVSVMHANNETGVIQPVEEIGAMCRQRALLFHTDAVQSVGKIPVLFDALGAHYLSLSAHKLGGPKGVGALIVDKHTFVEPLLRGGGQERGRRSGTEHVAGVVGCGHAAERVGATQEVEGARIRTLRDMLEARIQAAIPEACVFGQGAARRLPNTTALGISGMHGEALVMNLDLEGFAVSSGSACASGRHQPSHVLMAMGVAADTALSMVRVSLGWQTTQDEVERFVERFISRVKRLRMVSGV